MLDNHHIDDPTNFTLNSLPVYPNPGARLLLDVTASLMLSSDNTLDFHNEICPVLPIF